MSDFYPSQRVSHGSTPDELARNLQIEKVFAGLFRRLASLANTLVQQATNQTELTAIQLGILLVLHQHEVARLRDISRYLHVDRSSLQEVVNRLVDRKLVSRSVPKDDRRAHELRLTPTGREALLGNVEAMISVQKLLIGDIDPERVEIAMDVLQQILKRYGY